MDMFAVKKCISYLFSPYSLSLVLLTAGIGMLVTGRMLSSGRTLAILGLVLLLAQSTPLVPNILAHAMEYGYLPIVRDADIPSDVHWVVVLSDASIDDPKVPVTSRNIGETLRRVVEGITLAWKIPDSRLLLSGGDVYGDGVAAKVMAEMAIELHFPSERIVKEGRSRDTEDQARLIAGMVGKERFLLVTSPRHMPRAMMLFKGYGMDPVPAPTSHPSGAHGSIPSLLLPSANAAVASASIAHELTGMAWFSLKRVLLP